MHVRLGTCTRFVSLYVCDCMSGWLAGWLYASCIYPSIHWSINLFSICLSIEYRRAHSPIHLRMLVLGRYTLTCPRKKRSIVIAPDELAALGVSVPWCQS